MAKSKGFQLYPTFKEGKLVLESYNPELEKQKSRGELEKEVAVQSLKDITTSQRKLEAIEPLLSTVRSELSKIPAESGVPGGVTGQFQLMASKMIPGLNPQLASLNSFIEGSRAQLARAMGDVGNLSEYEQKAVKNLLPTGGESIEERNMKLSILDEFLKAKKIHGEMQRKKTLTEYGFGG